jgi:hypothetical protein
MSPSSPSSPGGRRRSAPDAGGPELAAKAMTWAEQTAEAQGLPRTVTDDVVIAQVSVLLASGREPSSGTPERGDAVGVEEVAAPDSRVDHDLRQHGPDDRPLASRVQVRPHRAKESRVPDEAVERRGA